MNDVFVTVRAYQAGWTNSNDELRQSVSGELGDFSLTAQALECLSEAN